MSHPDFNSDAPESYVVECESCGCELHDCGYDDNEETNPDCLPVSNHDESGHYCDDCMYGAEYDGQPDEMQEWHDFDPDC